MKLGWAYITSNFGRTVLYVGSTSDIVGRMWDHKNGTYQNSFTKRYRANQLVYFEVFDSIEFAVAREIQLKGWSRERKFNLIKNFNPKMNNLFTEDFIKSNY